MRLEGSHSRSSSSALRERLDSAASRNAVCAKRNHHPGPFAGVSLRHHRDERVARHRADDGEAGARISAGQLDDGLPGLQEACILLAEALVARKRQRQWIVSIRSKAISGAFGFAETVSSGGTSAGRGPCRVGATVGAWICYHSPAPLARRR
jgi:hypothetical protein